MGIKLSLCQVFFFFLLTAVFKHNYSSYDRYLALEGLCLMSNSEFSVDAVRKHQETVVSALKVSIGCLEWKRLMVIFSVGFDFFIPFVTLFGSFDIQ